MTAPVSALPQPISTPLREAIERAVKAVPPGKRGVLEVSVSHTGAEVSLGWRPRPGLTLSGFGSGLWRGGTVWGAKGQLIW